MKPIAIAEPTKFPVRLTGEPTKITVYREPHNDGHRFVVTHYDSSGCRKRLRCPTYSKAAQVADTLRKQIKAGDWDAIRLRGREKFVYERCLESLRPCGRPLDLAMDEYVRAVEILKGADLLEAVRLFAQRRAENVTPKPVPEIVSELLEAMKSTGKSHFYLRDLRLRLGAFAKSFLGPLASVSGKDISDYVQALSGGPRYRNNVLQDVGKLCSFARSRNYVPRDYDGISKIDRNEVETKEVEVLTPAELKAMFAKANPTVQLALALTGFAGVRGSELGRLDWSDIRFDDECIRVKATTAKTKMRRLPPIPPNLKEWLMLYRKESGPVVPYKNLYNYYGQVAKLAGVKWKRNALRHSFVSYRTAQIKSFDQVSTEAGHSKQMLFNNYHKVVSAADAEAWFAIFPPGSGCHRAVQNQPRGGGSNPASLR